MATQPLADEWYYLDGTKPVGPFTRDVMRQLKDAGRLTAESHVACAGQNGWKPLSSHDFDDQRPPVPPPAKSVAAIYQRQSPVHTSSHISQMVGHVSAITGLEKLEGFSFAHLMSEVFRGHTTEEIEERFVGGTHATTPLLQDVDTSWPTPWAFGRLLLIGMFVTVGFYWALLQWHNPRLIPGWFFIGSFTVPFATLVFFMEVNVLKNVSFYRVLKLLIAGGVVSLVITHVLGSLSEGLNLWLGAMAAGPVEEAAKLATVVIFASKWRSRHFTLNGMLFGAAVGAGFAAFESAGYIFESFMGDFTGTLMGYATGPRTEFTMLLRAVCSPACHVVWTAATSAALWRVLGDKPFDISILGDLRFLRVFSSAVILHVLWNSPLRVPLFGEGTGYFLKWVILGVVAWIIVLLLLQAGLREVRALQIRSTDCPDPVEPIL